MIKGFIRVLDAATAVYFGCLCVQQIGALFGQWEPMQPTLGNNIAVIYALGLGTLHFIENAFPNLRPKP